MNVDALRLEAATAASGRVDPRASAAAAAASALLDDVDEAEMCEGGW